MGRRRNILIFLLSLGVFTVLAFGLPYYSVDQEIVGLSLSVTGILFGLLSSFFISQMWNKYTSIRRHSANFKANLIMLIQSVQALSDNEQFKEEFEATMEQYLVAYMITPWHEIEREDRYFNDILDRINDVRISEEEDGRLFAAIQDAGRQASKARANLKTLGKERLFPVEWAVLIVLSAIILLSVALMRDGSFLTTMLAILLPPVVILILLILDDLNNLRWNITSVSFEPAEKAFDVLGVDRFYLSDHLEEGIIEPPADRAYRTEDDLEGNLREMYEEYEEEGLASI